MSDRAQAAPTPSVGGGTLRSPRSPPGRDEAASCAPGGPPGRGERHFRWRGGGVSRVEGLSDGVFALALTLLVVSLDPPESFGQMLGTFKQVPVFLLTYAMFGWVWYLHHQFHRRYGLEDAVTVTWNLVLLFVVLLYVYPLRFLATALCRMFGILDPPPGLAPGQVAAGLGAGEMQTLMLLYGAGFVALFGVMAMLYRHAWSLRDALALDEREAVVTRWSLRQMQGVAGVGVLSLALAAAGPGTWQFLAGIAYALTGPVCGWAQTRAERELQALGAAAPATAPGPA